MSDNDSDFGSFLAGFVIGGLVGAAVSLVLAPQSGAETRSQLTRKGRSSGEEEYVSAVEFTFEESSQYGQEVEEQTRIILDTGPQEQSTADDNGSASSANAEDEASTAAT